MGISDFFKPNDSSPAPSSAPASTPSSAPSISNVFRENVDNPNSTANQGALNLGNSIYNAASNFLNAARTFFRSGSTAQETWGLGSTPSGGSSPSQRIFSPIDNPYSPETKGVINAGSQLANFAGGVANIVKDANSIKATSNITNPTKIVTVEMPKTGNEHNDQVLDKYISDYSQGHREDFMRKYSDPTVNRDKAMADLKAQIDKAPHDTKQDLVERARMIAEYQFLEAVKNFGIYMDYDIKDGYDQVRAMDEKINELSREIRYYENNTLAASDAASMAAVDAAREGRTEEEKAEYEQNRADLAALQQYRAALKLEVDEAKRTQLGEVYNDLANHAEYADRAKKGASMANNARIQHANDSSSLYSYMTEEEAKMYDALLTVSKDSAETFYNFYLGEVLKQRKGMATAETIDSIDNDFAQTLAAQGYGLYTGVDRALRGIGSTITGGKEQETKARDYAARYIREDLGKMNTGLNALEMPTGMNLSQAAFDASGSFGNMLPMIATSYVLGGLGASAFTTQLASGAVMGAGVYGNVKSEMLKAGYNDKAASTYAALNAASEVALEKVLGGFEAMGGAMGIPGLEESVAHIGNAYLRYAATMGVKALGEGTEEYLQDVIDPIFRNYTFGENNEIHFMSEEGAYSFIVAALSVLGGPTEFIGTYRSVARCEATGAYVNAVRNANPELYNTLLDTAIKSGNEDIADFAQKLKDGDYKPNNGNTGQLLLMMAETGAKTGKWSDVKQAAEDFIKLSSAELGSLKFDAIQSDARAKAQAEWDAIVAANPDKQVLNPIASELHAKTGWDIETTKEQAEIIAKMVSGISISWSEFKNLDINNKNVIDLIQRYTGVWLDASMDRGTLYSYASLISKSAAQTEVYQEALKKANESFLQQRSNFETLAQNPEYADRMEKAAAEAEKGTDIQIGAPRFRAKKNAPIIPRAKSKSSAESGTASGESITLASGVQINKEKFIQDFLADKKGDRAAAEAAWGKLVETNSALGGSTNGEQVRGGTEGRVDGVAERSGTSEIHERGTESGQPESESGVAGSDQSEETGAKLSGPVIAESDYTPEQKAFTEKLKADGFKTVTLVNGELRNDAGQLINAKVDKQGNLTLRTVDTKGQPIPMDRLERVAKHERVHLWLSSLLGSARAEFVRRTADTLLPERIRDKMFQAYAVVYGEAYPELANSKNAADQAKFVDIVYEEMLADMFGGMNNYGLNAFASNYQDAATRAIEKAGLRSNFLRNGIATEKAQTSQQTSQVETTQTEQTTQETKTETGPPKTDDRPNLNDLLTEEDYSGSPEELTEIQNTERPATDEETPNPREGLSIEEKVAMDIDWSDEGEDLPTESKTENWQDNEYYSVAATDKRIHDSLSPETQQNLADNDMTIQNGVIVTNENAELMRKEGYQKPQTWDERYSVATVNEWEQNYQNSEGYDPEVAAAVRRITDWMIADEAVYNYLPHGEYASSKFGPIRPNQEYIVTFDMDTSCPRTFEYIYIRDQLQRAAKRPLTFNESINLMNLMKLTNQMIPCTYCYVENKRILKSNQYLNYFAARDGVMSAKDAASAKKLMYSYNAKKGTLGKAAQEVFNQWRNDVATGQAFHPSADECWGNVMKAQMYISNWLDGMLQMKQITKDTAVSELVEKVNKKFNITDAAAQREVQNFVDQWVYETKADIGHNLALQNIGAIGKIDQRYLTVHNAAMQYANSSSSARSIDNYVPYTDQLKNISDEDRAFVMGMGGIRKHSSNDFRMDYVQDYLMFYADLAAGKWTGHTYTKSTDFCKIFGRTGDRINLSIAFDTKDGKVIMNDQEGANWNEAKELRAAYFNNLGTMAMVTDDLQLSYALNSNWIDMIIPFHASGLPKAVWKNMKAWNDYTSKQLEKYLTADDMRTALKARGIPVKSGTKAAEVAALYNKEFGIKFLYNEEGKRKRPHFYPNDTYIKGPNGEMQLVPGHHNDVETYFKLCEEYGVHPRFYGLNVTDAKGNVIPVTEHPNYLKLIKETARTETEQKAIEFNLEEYDDYLGMSPLEYVQQRLHDEAQSGGYESAKSDPAGLINLFKQDYLGKDHPIGYISEAAQTKIDAYEGTAAYRELTANALGLQNVNDVDKLHGTTEAAERNSVAGETDNDGVVEYYSLSANPEHLAGVNISDDLSLGKGTDGDNLYYTDLILRGLKTIETRDKPSLGKRKDNSKTGRRLANADGTGGTEVAIVSTNNPRYLGVPMVVGYMKYGEPIRYDTYEQFRADFNRHQVPEGSQYDMKPGQVKYGYPILSVRAEPNPYEVTERGIVFRDAERSAQKDWVEKNIPKQPIPASQMIAKYGQEYYNKRGWSYADSGPMIGTEFKKWSSDFAAQISEERRNKTGPVVTWISPEKGGNGFYKIILAEGGIEDPTILKVLNLEDRGFDSNGVDQLSEVLRNEPDKDRFVADLVRKGILRSYDISNPEGNLPTDVQPGGRGLLRGESQGSGRTLRDGTGSAESRNGLLESTVTERNSITSDVRADNGDGRFALDEDVEQEPVITPEVAAKEIEETDTRYSIRSEDPPKKTMIGYKVFRVDKDHPGQLYPTKVENPGGQGTPVGVWLNADTGEIARNKDGSIKTNTRGRISVKADGGTLAWRPGWHLGSLPEANQMNQYDPNNPDADRVSEGVMHDDYVFCECEFAADEDYQLEAFQMGFNEKGSYAHSQAGLPYIPKDGYYKYRTNPDPNTAPWFISGAIKITKILDDNMRRDIINQWNQEHPNEPPMRIAPRYSGRDIDLSEYGFTAGEVTPTENLGEIAPGVDYSDEIRNLPGYKPSHINWNNKNFQNAFTINQIEDRREELRQKYEANQERYSIASDADYQSAVDSGDVETAQQMVDAKAQEAGYTKQAFHGTTSQFWTFARGKEGIHFGDIQQAVDTLEKDKKRNTSTVTPLSEVLNNLDQYDENDLDAISQEIEMLWKNPFIQGDFPQTPKNYDSTNPADIRKYAKRVMAKNAGPELTIMAPYADKDRGRIINAYIKTGNVMTIPVDLGNWSVHRVVDALLAKLDGPDSGVTDIDGSMEYQYKDRETGEIVSDYWNPGEEIEGIELTGDDRVELNRIFGTNNWEQLAAFLHKKGVDSIEYTNMYEGEEDAPSYLLLDPEQVKLADPVTYDDDGKVIPLSQRFNSESNDMRYSLTGSEQDMYDLLKAEGPEAVENWVNNQLEKAQAGREQRSARPVIPSANQHVPVGEVEHDIQRKQLDALIKKYGRLEQGEKPARDVALPRKTGAEHFVRRAPRTMAEAGAIRERTVENIERAVVTHDDIANYARISDTAANSAADKYYATYGYGKMLDEWNKLVDSNQRVTKYDIAKGERLLIEADAQGDNQAVMKLVGDIAAMATEAGQVVQAMRLLKKMGPIGQLYYFQKAVDRMNKKYEGRIVKGNMTPIHINQEMAEKVLLAQTQEEIDAAMEELIKDTAKQLPVSLADKWNAWRYLSMLGNPRTHIRNILGNLLFRPLITTKDLLAAAGESIFLKDRSQRTKSASFLLSGGRASAKYRDVVNFANSDFKVMQSMINGTGKMNTTNLLLSKREIFKGPLKFLNTLSEGNGNLLEWEDGVFLKKAYVNALSEYMIAQGLTAEDVATDSQALNQARQYAVLEAQKATYRDYCGLANALNSLRNRDSLASQVLVDGIMPFTKTPTNILRRGIEYSPIGLIKSLTYDLAKVKQGDYTAAEAIDHFAAGMTGTMICVLGAFLASMGIARGADDDDKKKAELERAQGHQEYSLEIGGRSYTVDWVAPVSLPFFVGVEAFKHITNGGPLDFYDVADLTTLIAEPMLSLSMLDGVNQVLTAASYGENNALQAVLTQVGTSYLSQGLPTLGAQIARTIDPYRRATYVDKGSKQPAWMQTFLQQGQGKIPGLASEKMAYVDMWGRKQTSGGLGMRALENFIFPFYMKNINENPVEHELLRLVETTGDNEMIPATLSKTFTSDGQKLNLNAKQYEQLKITNGRNALQTLGELMLTPAYNEMDDEQKVAAIKNALTVTTSVGRLTVDKNFKPAAWVQRAIEYDNWQDAVMFHTLQQMETGLSNYQLIECMYWLHPEEQGKLITAQYTPQKLMTDYTQKKFKFELDDDMKARSREIYEQMFWEAYPELYNSPAFTQANIRVRAEMVKDLVTDVGKAARSAYGDELRAQGVQSFYSDDPMVEEAEIAAFLNEFGYED